ncbi:MAG: ergothioneine biosynthesis protein EgtB [Acidimicrobiia bacterium]
MTAHDLQPPPPITTDRELRDLIARELTDARARTLRLLAPVPDAEQERQVSDLMSPLCWDLAHIGHFEELWLVRELGALAPTDERFDDVYDAFKHPRRERASLPILGARDARRFVASIRERAMALLHTIDLDAGGEAPLLADGFVYGMVVQHEHQHDETILATLQLDEAFAHPDAGDAERGGRVDAPTRATLRPDVLVPAGEFTMGTDAYAWAYDNERPAHWITLPAFRIDTAPVTNAAYAAFIDDGGYRDPRHWSHEGWAWREEASLVAPEFWHRHDERSPWMRRRFGRVEAVPADEPVQHVCWYEADAYARWSGARLPTEAEWERAARGADVHHANLWPVDPAGTHRWAPSLIGTRVGGVSDVGAHHMLGDVWEWTASSFHGHPGFVAFPYPEYSEVFFGPDHKVLRGGSWATHPSAVRTTFRNWDFPIRRQIFAGFRCARDV